MVNVIKGNIFSSNCQTLVNTVNCVGVMGAGIALEYKLRYPRMYERFRYLCEQDKIKIGKLWLYKDPNKWILNFPTKIHWRYPSKVEYLQKGLDKFVKSFSSQGIKSIAFPILGSDKGGIQVTESLDLMCRYLDPLDIHIEIYKYDPSTYDDLYNDFRIMWSSNNIEVVSKASGIRKQYLFKVNDAIHSDEVRSISQLASVKGIGSKTVEKLFNYLSKSPGENQKQLDFWGCSNYPECSYTRTYTISGNRIDFANDDFTPIINLLNEKSETQKEEVVTEVTNQMVDILEHFISCTWGAHYNTMFDKLIKPYLTDPSTLDFVLKGDSINEEKGNVIKGKTGAKIYPELMDYLMKVESQNIINYLQEEFESYLR